MNEFEERVYKVLLRKYPDPEWIVLPQVRSGTGWHSPVGGQRCIDFFIINTWSSKNYKCIAIEVKKTIEDYRSDVKNPRKQMLARFYSDEFYYLLPEDVYIRYEEEISKEYWKADTIDGSGFMVLSEKGTIRKAKGAGKHRSKNPFSIEFICSLLRQALRY